MHWVINRDGEEKNEFLLGKMKWPLKYLSLFPHVFGCSMEKRIVPRCEVIKALMSKGLLGIELFSIFYLGVY